MARAAVLGAADPPSGAQCGPSAENAPPPPPRSPGSSARRLEAWGEIPSTSVHVPAPQPDSPPPAGLPLERTMTERRAKVSAAPDLLFLSEYRRQYTWKTPMVPRRDAWSETAAGAVRPKSRETAVQAGDGTVAPDQGIELALARGGPFRGAPRPTVPDGYADNGDADLGKAAGEGEIRLKDGRNEKDEKPKREAERPSADDQTAQETEIEARKTDEGEPMPVLSYGHANRWPRVKELDMKTFNSRVHDKQDAVNPKRCSHRSRTRREPPREQLATPKGAAEPAATRRSRPSETFTTEYRRKFVNWFRDPEIVCWSNWTCGPDSLVRVPRSKISPAPAPTARPASSTSPHRPAADVQPTSETSDDRRWRALPPPAGVPADKVDCECRALRRRRSSGGRRHYQLLPDAVQTLFEEGQRAAVDEERLELLKDRLRKLRKSSTPPPEGEPVVPHVLSESLRQVPPVPAAAFSPQSEVNDPPDGNNFTGPTLVEPIPRVAASADRLNSDSREPQRVLQYAVEPPTTFHLARQLYRRAAARGGRAAEQRAS